MEAVTAPVKQRSKGGKQGVSKPAGILSVVLPGALTAPAERRSKGGKHDVTGYDKTL